LVVLGDELVHVLLGDYVLPGFLQGMDLVLDCAQHQEDGVHVRVRTLFAHEYAQVGDVEFLDDEVFDLAGRTAGQKVEQVLLALERVVIPPGLALVIVELLVHHGMFRLPKVHTEIDFVDLRFEALFHGTTSFDLVLDVASEYRVSD